MEITTGKGVIEFIETTSYVRNDNSINYEIFIHELITLIVLTCKQLKNIISYYLQIVNENLTIYFNI